MKKRDKYHIIFVLQIQYNVICFGFIFYYLNTKGYL